MTSRHSTNKYTVSFGKMLAEALRRCNWMIALSALASFLAEPVCFLFVLQSYESRLENSYQTDRLSEHLASSLADYFGETHAWLQLTVVIVGAVIVSVFGFRYLYHRRSADLYGSMPVTRGRQFLAQYLAGFLTWFVPFVTGAVLILLIGAFRISGDFGVYAPELVKVCGLMIFNFLIVYNGCLAAVQLSGNTANALLDSILCGVLAIAAYGIYYLHCEKYLETFFVGSDRWLQLCAGLSPMAAPFALTYYASENALPEHVTLLITSGILMLVNFILAKVLHKLRPSETAEHGLECRPVRILLRAVISVGTGLLLGMFFSGIANDELEQGWTMFGCIFGTVLAFMVLNVIFHASFRDLLSHKLQMAGCALFAVAVLLGFRMDVFGYDTYVADEADITALAIDVISLHDDGYIYIWDEAAQKYTYNYEEIPTATVSTDASEIYKTLVTLTDDSREKDYTQSWTMDIRVFTKTGIYSRTYRVYRSDLDMVAPLLETDAYRDTYYPASTGSLVTPAELTVWSLDGTYLALTDTDKISQLYSTYQEEFLEHYCSELILSESGMSDCIRLHFTDVSGYTPSLTVYPCFTRTLGLLQEWYPEYAWTLDDLEITALHTRFMVDDVANSEESVEAMLDKLGVDDETRADLADLITEAKGMTNYSDWWTTDEELTDSDLIAELTPRLSTCGYSEAAEMTELGYVTALSASSEEFTAEVYVEKGKVPARVIELLLRNYIEVNNG